MASPCYKNMGADELLSLLSLITVECADMQRALKVKRKQISQILEAHTMLVLGIEVKPIEKAGRPSKTPSKKRKTQ